MLVHGDGAVGNQDIIIQNNRFVSNYQGDVDVQWTNGLTLTGNVLVGPAAWPPGLPPQSAILLANSRNVTLKGNLVRNMSRV